MNAIPQTFDTQAPGGLTDNQIDQYVGDRVRARRRELSLSQTDLATAVGVTFQQVQKYERGFNRISASKLYQIGHVLKVEPGYFFDGLERVDTIQNDEQYRDAMTFADAAFALPKAKREILMEIARIFTAS